MKDLMDMQKKLYPDITHVIGQRYSILGTVDLFQPIGRRSLAENTGITERVVRSEIAFLHKQDLIDITTKGMHITKEGKLVLEQLSQLMKEISGLATLERKLEKELPVKKVIVVPGNSDVYAWVKQEMGKACVSHLKLDIKPKHTIAVTGGTTMAALSDVMIPLPTMNNGMFLPARGGLGENAENQANAIATKMAKKANGTYRQLYVPDPLSESSYQTIIQEPTVIDVLQRIKNAEVVIHGIGDALTMANRRKTSTEILEKLTSEHAVGEAFGYYFDADGHIVHKVRTVGIHLEDLPFIETVITIAGGKSKARPITSYFKHAKSDVLITDESAAKEILKGMPL
ncbi:MAG TPA: sugar-binding domain-containing protein [Bacillota bacterium]|nr:sugar-binding domain-containing protein [Bacillota bacterium]